MIKIIKNHELVIEISLIGAELMSVKNAKDGKELLWQGEVSLWDRRSPVLFPIIGKLKNQIFEHNGVVIDHPIHGFIKDSLFEVVFLSSTRIRMNTKSNERTFQIYPFEFSFYAEYWIEENTLYKEFTIENRGNETLYFELGGHDGFILSRQWNESISDFDLEFGELDYIMHYEGDDKGFLTKVKRKILLEDGCLPIDKCLFKKEALKFKICGVREVILKNRITKRSVKVNFDDFDYLAIWQKYTGEDVNFICIEPWTSLPDAQGNDIELKKKNGIQSIYPFKKKLYRYLITFQE